MFNADALIKELEFKAVKSSGAGGQHVNKTASKVELYFNVAASEVLNEEQKALLIKNLGTRLTKDRVLMLQCGESRSQHKNKETVISRFLKLVSTHIKRPKKRKKTTVPKMAKLKRLQNKKQQSEKKANRKPPKL
ncbi:peptide chain release factor 1 [Mangrovimonas yunxiaonensis]|uniref:Peptide chain release factor 1 n=1 Tax=Mangrovimonas yunxiaonensis TaxID=1197477 RepID=A0A084TLD3_9FLAO|nr:alternative ribosome rescue aminoacyl-tRNA hydrolase ArfB [Mangrovimonas yunxiaonensis]KFB01519.1 peptide chain release factor 1 [Mangrovimonas yunxiaonensis]MBR9758348.1 aminoacyl-tRNA hydrolase [Algicola sp.]GGH36212.1 aminoacyl-tRNA hydrolase [Mangrovimonas yunxiaonensis]